MRMELAELPPAYRAQAERKLAEREKRRDPFKAAAEAAKKARREFDSIGEYRFFMVEVLPKLKTGEIVRCEQHPRFRLFEKSEYSGIKLGEIRYTADFRLDYADGTVEIVEVKSKFVRRMQRDYPVRRRVFLEQIASPEGWRFREIITEDSKEEIKRWRELAKEAKP